jgi:hypothetical protein
MRIRVLVCFALALRAAGAQEPGRSPGGALVSGVVRDSIAHRPLAGAVVQLVIASGNAPNALNGVADSVGRFTIRNVPQGRHTIGFFHPMLDSLGLDAPQHQLEIGPNETVRVDLGIPSAERIRAAVCGGPPAPGRTLIMGFVRHAAGGAQVGGAHVTARWSEISFGGGKPVQRSPQLVAISASNGWFAICNAPSNGMLILSADHERDSTDVIELEMPADGFLRRDLHVGLSQAGDSVAAARRLRRGEGRVSGTVVALVDGRPLGGATVGIVDGPRTRANERGEWSLAGAPSGTRMLEIRALGYYPTRRAIDVVEGAAPVRVALPTLKSVLDTVRVTAARIADRYKSGFDERRRIGIGHYVTAEDIARRRAVSMAQVLRSISGLRLDATLTQTSNLYDSTGALIPQYSTSNSKILMRGSVGDWCYPAIYVDGHMMQDLDADDVNMWLRPEEVLGIEVYPGISAPPEFQPGMSGCGSILIWRK